MAEDGVINGSLKVTLVAAKGLKSVGSAAPSSLVRLRILNSDPSNPKAKPIVSGTVVGGDIGRQEDN